MFDYLRHARRTISKEGLPLYLIFFVTSKCDGSCKHCFYWKSINKPQNELTLDEISKISESMDDLLQLTLTGGDAALRDDVPDIIRLFDRNNNLKHVTIGTNGYRTQKVLNMASKTCEENPGLNVTIDLSVDGLGADHDSIRDLSGLFDRVVDTHNKLDHLKRVYDNLATCVDITVSSYNQEKLAQTYEFIRDDMKPDIINAILVRGEPRDEKAQNVDVKYYRKLIDQMEKDIRGGKIKGYKFLRRVLNAKDILLRNIAADVYEKKQFVLPCYAGKLMAVIYPEGDVYPCELLDSKMGGLREYDCDFRKLWTSEKADSVRKLIGVSECFCTHQCFLSSNILFNPLLYPTLIERIIMRR